MLHLMSSPHAGIFSFSNREHDEEEEKAELEED